MPYCGVSEPPLLRPVPNALRNITAVALFRIMMLCDSIRCIHTPVNFKSM